MALTAGIIGLPNVGKSTLFNAITNAHVEVANYPFATINPNIGVVEVSDYRITKIAELVKPKKLLKASFGFADIAGLVKGASKGEGLGNKFLTNIRETDAIVQVVRCFRDQKITHVSGGVDPVRDIQIINTELMLADMETVQNVLKRIEKKALVTKNNFLAEELKVAKKLQILFEKEIPARKFDWLETELKIIKGYNLFTLKPIIYVGNVAEDFVANPEGSFLYREMQLEAQKQGARSLGISVKIENELSQLDSKDKKMFLDSLGIKVSGLDRLIKSTFGLLNLATYFTAGKQEVRAWTFKKGMNASQCAGIIHTDFEKGFIRAEIISYDDYIINGGERGSRDCGKFRLEGKKYIMKDGDICYFRFNN